MNRKRAKEIASSPEMMAVTYNGSPIYIEDVNPTKDSASIHYLDQPHNSQEVSLTQLVEVTSI
ncbi:MAG: small acid-soluble spore protein H-type [Clostridiales bacterium]|jgi:small acid-soluble spore protein H (minor)|nr:small acid-soluble spore protein H-type [Clostridiales bacterium]